MNPNTEIFFPALLIVTFLVGFALGIIAGYWHGYEKGENSGNDVTSHELWQMLQAANRRKFEDLNKEKK